MTTLRTFARSTSTGMPHLLQLRGGGGGDGHAAGPAAVAAVRLALDQPAEHLLEVDRGAVERLDLGAHALEAAHEAVEVVAALQVGVEAVAGAPGAQEREAGAQLRLLVAAQGVRQGDGVGARLEQLQQRLDRKSVV